MTGTVKKQKVNRLQARGIELIFDGHLNGEVILEQFRKVPHGLYKAFVKWHHGKPDTDLPNPHTHVALILRDKPQIPWDDRFDYFKVEVLGVQTVPRLCQPLGKGNAKPLKKMATYVSYLVDGHDNGHYEDTWNYKYDHELIDLKPDGKILCLLSRGKDLRTIIEEGDWTFKAYCFKHKDLIDKMINNWRKFQRDDTVHHELEEFTSKARDSVSDWDPRTHTLILKGPSNMGKTEFAKALLKRVTQKNPIFCSNLNKLRYRDTHQPFILDDMNFRALSRTKGIALTDIENERDIRILFGIHTIDAGTARIFTTNEDMEDYLPMDLTGAIGRRIKVVDMESFGRLY